MSHPIERGDARRMNARLVEEELAVMRPPLVLVADDDDDIRAVVAAALRGEGCDVVEAKDGAELLERMADHDGEDLSADVIVTDLRMPGVTGLEAMLALRRANWQAPMILMTAYADAEVCADAERLGVEVVLQKPFEVHDLVAAVLSRLSAQAWARSARWADHAEQVFGLGTDHTPG